MSPVAGSVITLAGVAALVAVCVRRIWKDAHSGGCAGCGNCACAGCAKCAKRRRGA